MFPLFSTLFHALKLEAWISHDYTVFISYDFTPSAHSFRREIFPTRSRLRVAPSFPHLDRVVVRRRHAAHRLLQDLKRLHRRRPLFERSRRAFVNSPWASAHPGACGRGRTSPRRLKRTKKDGLHMAKRRLGWLSPAPAHLTESNRRASRDKYAKRSKRAFTHGFATGFA